MHKFSVRLLPTGDSYDCGCEETLLQGMARIGKKGIPVGCLNGGCGVCKVSVCGGSVRKTGCMSRAHVSEEEEAQGVVLACRVVPTACVELTVLGPMKKALTRHPPFQPRGD
ncbi:MAG: 2Fe-2S iron-sulfur cluster binding domain-containing protein [Variovorax sp.]|nr:MAG: 2Fe-2S iron-sulfur cluster binding domain-containing protein [Variovorax sp.]